MAQPAGQPAAFIANKADNISAAAAMIAHHVRQNPPLMNQGDQILIKVERCGQDISNLGTRMDARSLRPAICGLLIDVLIVAIVRPTPLPEW